MQCGGGEYYNNDVIFLLHTPDLNHLQFTSNFAIPQNQWWGDCVQVSFLSKTQGLVVIDVQKTLIETQHYISNQLSV